MNQDHPIKDPIPGESGPTDDEQAIRSLVARWMEASKAGDTETVLSLMSDDVIFMVPGKTPFGKRTFAKMGEQMKGVAMEGSNDIQEIQILGNWAWMRNYLRITITPPKGKSMTRSGYTLTILHKGPDGKWVLARDANLVA